jgi:hypothetical protein
VISSVVRAVGGVSPCLLYQGFRTADHRPASKRRLAGLAQRQALDVSSQDQLVPDCGADGYSAKDSDALMLYIRWACNAA